MTCTFPTGRPSPWTTGGPGGSTALVGAVARHRVVVSVASSAGRPLAAELQDLMADARVTTCQAGERIADLLGDDADLLVVGIGRLSDGELMDLVAEPRRDQRGPRLVVCYGDGSQACAHALMRSGVAALVPDTVSGPVLVQILELVLSGLRYVPPDLMMCCSDPTAALPGLSPRERQVACFVAQGRSNKEIARQLGLSEITIKVHVSNLLRKLQARNRTEAASHLLSTGLLALADGAGPEPATAQYANASGSAALNPSVSSVP